MLDIFPSKIVGSFFNDLIVYVNYSLYNFQKDPFECDCDLSWIFRDNLYLRDQIKNAPTEVTFHRSARQISLIVTKTPLITIHNNHFTSLYYRSTDNDAEYYWCCITPAIRSCFLSYRIRHFFTSSSCPYLSLSKAFARVHDTKIQILKWYSQMPPERVELSAFGCPQ